MSNDRQSQDLENAFVEHRVRLRQAAQQIVGTRDLAEDVLQSAYLRIRDAPPRMAIQQPAGYCFQVVRHLAIDYRRRMALESQLFTLEERGLTVASTRSYPEQAVSSWHYLSLVEQALLKLPDRTRRAFKMYRLDGLTQREIAVQLGVSATLVNFMIRDAIDALKLCRQSFEQG